MRTSNILLGSLTLLFCLIGVNSSQVQSQSTYNWLSQVVGSYKGQISSGGNLVSATTEFILSDTGALIGSYGMSEASGLTLGTLTQCRALEMRLVRCIWHDRYGTGDLEISFSDTFNSFNGTWGTPNATERSPWKGSKIN